ncbi:MAG TPA: LysM peptidoglycan-binding domain-containing protein [Thermoanaerobaculia bacterium]|nr:LysM peptidoglycan-binding domain-containing protein [Thermoanaerobaculia bacterium]
MRVRLAGCVLATLALGTTALAAPAAGSDRPPRNLHQVGNHWTAWDPPTPAEGVQVYTIVRGDTLWDLAKRFFGNPYLWPQLWEKNQYILDAHWIYPGDPLVTGIQVAPVDNLAAATSGGPSALVPIPAPGEGTAPPPEVKNVESSAKTAGAPIPLGAESDIYCTGFIADDQELQGSNYTVVGSEYDVLSPAWDKAYKRAFSGKFGLIGGTRYNLTVGDILYVDAGSRQGLAVHSLWTIIGGSRAVVHPVSGKIIGRFFEFSGRLRVLTVQENVSIAEVVHACGGITIGSRLIPWEPEPVPLGRPTPQRPVNFPAAAEKLESAPVVLLARDRIIALGQNSIVFIDRGADQNVTPGDFYTIYRLNRPGLPPVPLGELAVLSVQKHTALARITESRFPVYLGDRLDPK